MNDEMRSLFVGHFSKISDSKKVENSLRDKGIASFLFSRDGGYSLLITSGNKESIDKMCKAFIAMGYDAFVTNKI